MYRNWHNLIRPRGLKFEEAGANQTYGKFVASPLERGFGITLGNALRRVLLSSLQGAAVTSVKLDGVLHEFSTIPGILEDVTDVILNLKQLKLRLHSGEEDLVPMDVAKEGVVRAKDLQFSSNIEVLNPDLPVCTLNAEGRLKGELRIQVGKGYVTAEQNKRSGEEVGVIPIDSIFSPVTRVNYNVTNARVGQRTDYDKLTMEIWTDGSVRPEDALAFSAKILKEQLQIFVNFDEGAVTEPTVGEEKTQEQEQPSLNPNLYRRVDELELSVRSANCLANANIRYIGELVQKSEPEMLKTKNFGRKSLNEIKEILTEMGLSLGMKLDSFQVEDAERFRPKDVE